MSDKKNRVFRNDGKSGALQAARVPAQGLEWIERGKGGGIASSLVSSDIVPTQNTARIDIPQPRSGQPRRPAVSSDAGSAPRRK